MDEQVVTEVNSNVREGVAHGFEKHQIAWLQIALLHGFATFADFPRCARQERAQPIKNMVDKTAAIEAGVGRGAAAVVADTDQLKRTRHGFVGAIAGDFEQRRLCLYCLCQLKGGDSFVGADDLGATDEGEQQGAGKKIGGANRHGAGL